MLPYLLYFMALFSVPAVLFAIYRTNVEDYREDTAAILIGVALSIFWITVVTFVAVTV